MYEVYIDEIKTKLDKSSHPGLSTVLHLMQKDIEPKIKRMKRYELEEAFAEAIYAIYCTDNWLACVEENVEHFRHAHLRAKLEIGHYKEALEKASKEAIRKQSQKALDARHKESRCRKNKIITIWKTGKYISRNRCADEEWQALGFKDFEAARKALENTPDPSPWLAKNL